MSILRKIFGKALSPERQAKREKARRKVTLPGWSPSYMRRLGDIKTVVDIGVLNGTPSLYEAFPDAYLVLVEALPQYRDRAHEIIASRKNGGEVHSCAAGAEDSELEINFLDEHPARSSLLTHLKGRPKSSTKIKIPQYRLDSLFTDKSFDGDILLKIDTEGYEYNIILGAPEFLKNVKYVIAETSVALRHKASYRFTDLANLMRSNGFEVFDFMTVTRGGHESPGASIADTIFINSALATKARVAASRKAAS